MGIGCDSVRVRQRRGLTPGRAGFTLTELMIVVGLVALLVALLLPVVGRMRAASGAVQCSANLRQLGDAWTVHVMEHEGRFIPYAFYASPGSGSAWKQYWPGIAVGAGVPATSFLCPAARDPNPTAANRGYGSASTAWTGGAPNTPNGSVIRFNAQQYHDGSYGYNRYLTVDGGFGRGDRMSGMRSPSDVPVFFDCAYVDAMPRNESEARPPKLPSNLRGDAITPASDPHWLFLLARHGRGINVRFADSSVRWVPAEDTYTMSWTSNWTPYRLELPN